MESQDSQPNKLIYELCERSSLHGFDRLSTSSYRPAWIMVITIATTICLAMFYGQIFGWEKNSTSTSIEVNYPSSSVQFPNLEICSKDKVYRLYTKTLEEMAVQRGFVDSEDKLFKLLKDFLSGTTPKDLKKHEQLLKILALLGYTYRGLILEVGMSCKAMLQSCSWGNIEIDCKNMFQRVVSFDGVCCRFDMDYFKTCREIQCQWIKRLVSKTVKKTSYALVKTATLYNTSIILVVYLVETQSVFVFYRNNTRDMKNMTYNAGFRAETGLQVVINLTAESLTASGAMIYFYYNDRTLYDTPYELEMAVSMVVGVKPEVISSSDNVRKLSPQRRNCGLIDKNSPSAVDTITKYTYQECLTHYYHQAMLDKCNCIPFYVKDTDPRGGWDKDFLCAADNLDCIQNMRSNLSKNGIPKKGCLHSCDEVSYKFGVKMINRAHSGWINSRLSVYFFDTHCYKFTRITLSTWDQFFASQGGILGISFGGSIISIVEFFYTFGSFLILRAVVWTKNVFQRKKQIKLMEKHKGKQNSKRNNKNK